MRKSPVDFTSATKSAPLVACGDVAGEHHADLVGEDRLALVVHDPAAVAVAVEGEPEIGAVLEHRVARRIQHGEIFGIGVVGGEGVVEVAIERDDRCAERGEHPGGERAGGAVAARDHGLQGTPQFRPRQEIGQVALGQIGHEDVAPGIVARIEPALEHDVLERGHVFWGERQRPLHAHLDAGPAIVVVARRDHGDAFDLELELGEIGHGREREPDVVHFGAAGE